MTSLKRISTYLRPYRSWVLAAFGLVAIEALSQLAVPRILEYVIDQGITPSDMRTIWIGSLLMLGMALIGAVATVRRAVYAARFSQNMAYDVRNDVFTRIQTLSFDNLDHLQTGKLITRVSSDVDVVRMFTSLGFIIMVRAVVLLLGSLIFLVATNARLSLIMLVIVPAIAIVFAILANIARPLFKQVQQRLDVLNTVVQENLAGVEVVKAFVRERFENNRYEEANAGYMEKARQVNRMMAVAFPTVMVIGNLGMLAVILLGGRQVIGGSMSVGELVAFTNYLMTAMFPVVMLGMIVSMLPAADASAERILEVLDTENTVKDCEDARPIDMRGRVVFDNVSFHYNSKAGAEVLRDINLTVEAGEQVAIMGATGSGKSTLVSLIPRFYDASQGQVLVDGVNVCELSEESLRSQIGIAMQQTVLFSGTIAENIAYGRPGASLEEIEAAARAAQAHDFIMARPDGYQSRVEARGANLSGGQKQRIAIARALLVNPSIVILDDSTSSVDMETEYHIQEALDSLMEGRTTFIIAQRLSSVLKADKIIILDQGQITAQGTHQELLQTSPIYQDIYRSQLSKDVPKPASPNDNKKPALDGGVS
jgi:ATP-binding cassette subfamily B multidrug efflux pump